MSALSIYILFLQLSPISILVTHNWLRDVAWSRDMTWDTIRMLRHGLSCLRVETRSEPRHEIDKVSINMRRGIHETRNTWDAEYIRQEIHETRNKAEMHANKTRDGAEMHSLAGTIWLHFQHALPTEKWKEVTGPERNKIEKAFEEWVSSSNEWWVRNWSIILPGHVPIMSPSTNSGGWSYLTGYQGMSPSCPHPIVVTVDVLLSPSYRGMCPSCPHLLAAAPDIVQGHVPITFLYRDDAYPRQVIPPWGAPE